MSYPLFYWEKSVINQPENGEWITAKMKSGSIESFEYLRVNQEWFIRNTSEWLARTSFTYEQLSKAKDFVSDCYGNYDCEKDRHKTNSCRHCNAKEILGI